MISFRGKYWFLSNFYPAELKYRRMGYQTAEHACQAAKAVNSFDRDWVRYAQTPGEAKRRGRRINIRSDWERKKLDIMLEVIRAKFKVKVLAEKLLATGDDALVEYNTWGKCNGKRENYLGKILMKVRKELRND